MSEYKTAPYTFRKDGIFLFTRRDPADLRRHSSSSRRSYSSRTGSASVACARVHLDLLRRTGRVGRRPRLQRLVCNVSRKRYEKARHNHYSVDADETAGHAEQFGASGQDMATDEIKLKPLFVLHELQEKMKVLTEGV